MYLVYTFDIWYLLFGFSFFYYIRHLYYVQINLKNRKSFDLTKTFICVINCIFVDNHCKTSEFTLRNYTVFKLEQANNPSSS